MWPSIVLSGHLQPFFGTMRDRQSSGEVDSMKGRIERKQMNKQANS